MPDTLHTVIPFIDSASMPEPVVQPQPLAPVDSLVEAYCAQPRQERPTLFAGHELPAQPHSQHRLSHPGAAADWMFLALLLLGGGAVLLVNQSRLRLSHVLRATIDNRSLGRLIRENSTKRFRMLIPMSLIYLATLLLLVPGLNPGQYALALAAAVGYYFLRNGLTRLMGTIFEADGATQVYVTNTCLYNTLGALTLLPLTLLALYGPAPDALLYTSLAAAALLFLARLGRGLALIFSAAKNSRFYLFYYLCTLEVVPPLILLKLFII